MIEDCAGQKNDVLSCPESGKNSCVGSIVERLECSYSNKSERFLLKKRDFNRQYAHIYSVRLMEMRKVAALAARRKWGMFLPLICILPYTGLRTVYRI